MEQWVDWRNYIGHTKRIYIRKKGNSIAEYDNTIYTFDIETSSILLDENNNFVENPREVYSELTKKEKIKYTPLGFMYIWQLSIEDTVYFGRTWGEFLEFYESLFGDDIEYHIWVHNLSWEFAFLKCHLQIDSIFSRKAPDIMKFSSRNVTFRCTFHMTGCKLEKVPELYDLKVKKKAGDLDYTKIRTSNTPLTQKETEYCMYDCLVLYELLKKLRFEYGHIHKIPLTLTSFLREELRKNLDKFHYIKNRDIISENPHFYNFCLSVMAGGYVHANHYKAKNIWHTHWYDESSAYPFAMACLPVFPVSPWLKVRPRLENLKDKSRIHMLTVYVTGVKSIKENTIISLSKCKHCSCNHKVDNGRLLEAEYIVWSCTNFDFEIFKKFYSYKKIKVLEMYSAKRGYLPEDFVKLVLEHYKGKTELKKKKGKEYEYAIHKARLNSFYGNMLTITIKDEVTFNDITKEFGLQELTDKDIEDKLHDIWKKGNLDLTCGIFVTSIMRYFICDLIYKLDKYVVYSDTDSLKLLDGFDESIIHRHNAKVLHIIQQAKKHFKLDGFAPKNYKGIRFPLGYLDYEGSGDFITYGAKKYASQDDEEGKIKLTVSGVPKEAGSNILKSLEDFKKGFVFRGLETGKNTSFYNNEVYSNIKVIDYIGNKDYVDIQGGISLMPCDYIVGLSKDYEDLLKLNSFDRKKYGDKK